MAWQDPNDEWIFQPPPTRRLGASTAVDLPAPPSSGRNRRRRGEHRIAPPPDRVAAGLQASSVGPVVPGQRLKQSLLGGRGLPQRVGALDASQRRLAILQRMQQQRLSR